MSRLQPPVYSIRRAPMEPIIQPSTPFSDARGAKRRNSIEGLRPRRLGPARRPSMRR